MGKSGYITDNTNIIKSSGTPNLTFNLQDSVFFKRNDDNIAYEVSSTQIPAMVGGTVIDLRLTKGFMREPHWHPNAWELDVVISGEVIVSIINPDIPQLVSHHAKPGQVVFIPMGWWHWITAVSDKAHMHLFFNNSHVENAEGSDILRLTPPAVFQQAYNVDAGQLSRALEPITETVVIGPPKRAAETTMGTDSRDQIIVNVGSQTCTFSAEPG